LSPRPAPAVSVVTLTWNHGERLAECVESVRRQSFQDWEQIVLDDGSTDGSAEALERAADPRVRILREPHRGADSIPASYRRAFSFARGRWIVFVDGDDLMEPRALEVAVAALADDAAVLAWGETVLFGERDARIPRPEVLARYPPAVLENDPVGVAALPFFDPLVTMPFTMSATLLRRSVLERIGGLQTRPGLPVMDHPTLLRLTLEGRFRRVDAVVARHRVAASTVSRREASRIDLGVYRALVAFRRRFGERLPIGPGQWRELSRLWQRRLAGRSLGNAGVGLLGERRWSAALHLGLWLLQTPRLWQSELARLGRLFARGGRRG
jgi:glycosyltransferase involved in cell wall biosynthesis